MTSETFKEPSQREDAKKTVKKLLEERYTSGKNRWFFTQLRVCHFLSHLFVTAVLIVVVSSDLLTNQILYFPCAMFYGTSCIGFSLRVIKRLSAHWLISLHSERPTPETLALAQSRTVSFTVHPSSHKAPIANSARSIGTNNQSVSLQQSKYQHHFHNKRHEAPYQVDNANTGTPARLSGSVRSHIIPVRSKTIHYRKLNPSRPSLSTLTKIKRSLNSQTSPLRHPSLDRHYVPNVMICHDRYLSSGSSYGNATRWAWWTVEVR